MSSLKNSLILLACLFLMPLSGWAQTLDQDLQIWGSVQLRKDLDEKNFVTLEIAPRWRNNVSEFSLGQLVPSIGHEFNDHVSAQVGYMIRGTNNTQVGDGNDVIWENRIWQDVTVRGQWKKLQLANRTRLEQRFFEDVEGVALRFRNKVSEGYPLTRNEKLLLLASQEFFLNLNSPQGGPGAGYVQSRAFAGLGYRLTEKASVETGYQLEHSYDEGPDPLVHTILLRLNYTF